MTIEEFAKFTALIDRKFHLAEYMKNEGIERTFEAVDINDLNSHTEKFKNRWENTYIVCDSILGTIDFLKDIRISMPGNQTFYDSLGKHQMSIAEFPVDGERCWSRQRYEPEKYAIPACVIIKIAKGRFGTISLCVYPLEQLEQNPQVREQLNNFLNVCNYIVWRE